MSGTDIEILKRESQSMSASDKKISKFLSLVLRHKPEAAGLTLDNNGWVAIEELIQGANNAGIQLNRDKLETVVRESDKQRFAIQGDRIRANQGHSVDVDLELSPTTPPNVLFHGTVLKFLAQIEVEGLQKLKRQHVHLSPDIDTAMKVGARRGKPIILEIDAGKMFEDGHQFYCSENGVWLTESVPILYIKKTNRSA